MAREYKKLQSLQEEHCESQSGTENRPPSPGTSGVSSKTDRSLPDRPNFKRGPARPESGTENRPPSPGTSGVSSKTDRSLPDRPDFKRGPARPESGTENRPPSPGTSGVSSKTDRSLPDRPDFKRGPARPESGTENRPPSPGTSGVSSKTDRSLPDRPDFKRGPARPESSKGTTLGLSESSHQPLKKNKFSLPEQGDQPSSESTVTSDKLQKKIKDIFDELERKLIVLIKHELEIYKKILRNENTKYYRNIENIKWDLRQGILNVTLSYLEEMQQEDLADALQNELIGIIQRPFKQGLRDKYHQVYEGIAKQGESNSLNKIYTDLYITEGGAGQVNKEHEVRLIQKNSVTRDTNQVEQEVSIICKDMFKPLPGQDKSIRTVMTQGVAGIGKSICVQKLILEWAENNEYKDIQFIFPLPFRELNLKKDGNQSLMTIINLFFPQTKGLRLTDQNKVLFIFDGLDECQLPLTFHENEILNDVSKKAPLDTVMTNLIRGNLLPSALIWITTRPAAASMIPPECIDRVTEVRGFNDKQKVEYFRKRISDKNLATKIIAHIQKSRSLHIMCHIPVFCWISATVLERILKGSENEDTPKTLTQMYTCFLIFQTVQGNLKYTGKNALDIPWNKGSINSLGELAFQHLEKNSLIFYSSDLEECGIEPKQILVYSGLCTQETVRFRDTVFSFVHLSIQEFLAAVFAYISLRNDSKNVFDKQSPSQESQKTQVIDFLKIAVDKALKSDHGQLDLFLRFLLGLSLQSNEELIQGLLIQKGSRSDCQKDIVEYIKEKLDKDRQNLSPERSINLFYCLNELNDDSLVKEVQSYLSLGRLSEAQLSHAQWSALVFVLLTSEENLDEFHLKKFIRSDECLIRLLPVVKEATSALLSECTLTDRSCSALLEVLDLESSKLTLLDLSNNPIQDTGVQQLSKGLKSANCKLENLSLSFCSITGDGYVALASALESNSSSHLTELDLRGNDPGDTGVEKLSKLLEDPKYKLNRIRFLSSPAKEACDFLTTILRINPLLQRELDLSGREQGDTEIKNISDLLEDSHCRIEKLKLNKCSITEEGCAALSSALCKNPSHLTELDLSQNKLENSGVKEICSLLNSQCCKLQKLGLAFCSITEEGYTDLTSTLISNPSSYLIELDLRGNDPGDKGVELITDLQKDPNCKLKTRLLNSPTAEEVCDSLTEVLGTNPLLLRELDLSGKIQGDLDLKKISDLLEDSHCRTQILKLTKCSITEEGCTALSSALCKNSSHLIELDLSENKLGNSGVKKICPLLKYQYSQLQKLGLSFCSITEEGYTALALALKSNPSSRLIELDLRGNDPGETGVKELTNLLDSNSKLKLKLLKTPAAVSFCDFLTKDLEKNPLLLRELDLSKKIQENSEVQQLCSLLEDSHCKIKKLMLNYCNLTMESCSALASILSLDSSSVRKMDLSNNNLDSGMQHLASGLTKPTCKLEILILQKCALTKESWSALADVLNSKYSNLNELDLSNNNLEDSGVLQLSSGLKNSECTLQIMRLSHCNIGKQGCGALASALQSNPSHLKELDLSENNVENSGVKQLSHLLRNSNCILQKLKVSDNNIREEGYADLASALKSNPSSDLIELDLSRNDPGDTGVELLTNLQKDPCCKLKTLKMLKSSAAEEVCDSLTKILGINPLLKKELDLSGKINKDSELKKFFDLLEDSHCRTQKLKLNKSSITETDCDALSSALCSNPSHLQELDLSENNLGNSGVKKICGVLRNEQFKLLKLYLGSCSITDEGCVDLASAFITNPSHLKELNLSGNKVGNSGVKHLCELLKHSKSTLAKLHLSFCSITEQGHEDMASALKANSSSHLVELDLRGNNAGYKGIEMFTELQEDRNCKLKIRMLNSSTGEAVCESLTKVLGKNPLLLRELDLSGKIQGDSEMKNISDLLKDSHCITQSLKLNKCSITEEGCAALSSALCKNPSHLIELDLSENKLGNSGVMHICSLLKNKYCQLQKLKISFCGVTEKGYVDLASALKSSSHLKELDLRGNNPGKKGVKKFIDLLEGSKYKLKTLRLLKSAAAEKIYDSLNNAVGTNPLLLTELDLSGKIQGDSKMKAISDMLEDVHCRPQKLKLNKCSITEEGCAALSSALCKNPSHLIELDLSENKLGNSGVMHICSLLKNKHCQLQKLNLSFCSIKEEGYAALASASSRLKGLDLRGNDPGETGVKYLTDIFVDSKKTLRLLNSDDAENACKCIKNKILKNPLLQRELDLSKNGPKDIIVDQLCALLKDPHYRLEKLMMYKSGSIEGRHCADLVSALNVNPSHLRELDLNANKLDESGVQKLCILLMNPHCKLQKLKLKKCDIEEKGCAALASALTLNPLHLRELDLHKNKLGESGMEELCNLLKNPHCKLEKLKLNKCRIKGKGCAALVSALSLNLPHLKELELSKNNLEESGVEKICNLLKNNHCKLEKLKLVKSLTEQSCADLASALCVNPSYIRELDLSENQLGNSGMKELCELLKKQECKLQKLLIKNCSIGDEGCAALTSAISSNPLQLKHLDLRKNGLGKSVKQLSEIMQKSESSLRLDASTKSWFSWTKSLIWKEAETEESSDDEETAVGEEEMEHRLDSQMKTNQGAQKPEQSHHVEVDPVF